MPVTNFIWNPLSDNVLMETDENDATVVAYTHEPGLFGELLSQDRGGVTSAYHSDGKYSTRQLTDDNQNVTDTATYSAFGEIVTETGVTTNPFGYKGGVGYYANHATDDLYVRARTYQPVSGRWLSKDPLGITEGPNTYRAYFIPNNVDPDGEITLSTITNQDKQKKLPWDTKPGTINLKLANCGSEHKKGTCGCCTDMFASYIVTDKDKKTYTKIYFKQWARSRLNRKGSCLFYKTNYDSGWHLDPPLDKMTEWPPLNPNFTDFPAIKPSKGRLGCGDNCATNDGRQDFETCVFGVLKSGVEVNIGCVHWGHTCKFSYKGWGKQLTTKSGHPTGCQWGCDCTLTMTRYPVNLKLFGIIPQKQQPSTWDPATNPPVWPGGISQNPNVKPG